MSVTNSSPAFNRSPHVPLVSVIMNCYNGENYLRDALESVINQTFQDWEIVFWDNCSTDNSADIYHSYSDSRLKYFLAPEHTTLGEARNLAVNEASGDWVAFLDCDDIWFPEKLAMQVQIVEEEGQDLGLVYGRTNELVQKHGQFCEQSMAMVEPGRQSSGERLPEGYIFPQLLRSNFVPLVSAMVRREFYWNVGGINPTFRQSEDYDLFLKITRKFRSRAVQTTCCLYRIHDKNISHSQVDMHFLEIITILKSYLEVPTAKDILKNTQLTYASLLLRRGEYLKGISFLIGSKQLLPFLKKSFAYIVTKASLRQVSQV